MACRIRMVLAAACFALVAGCATLLGVETRTAEKDEGPLHSIYIFSNEWHTSIVIERRLVEASGLMPETADFPEAAFFEFSFGDRDYGLTPQPTLATKLSAIFWPSPGVIHMSGLRGFPGDLYPDWEVVAVSIRASALRELIRRLHADYDRGGSPRAQALRKGLYPDSLFYPSTAKYHLFNTCNAWIARHLETAGLDISPIGVFTANDLMHRVRAFVEAPAARTAQASD